MSNDGGIFANGVGSRLKPAISSTFVRKVEIEGMTCGKCERLIREGLTDTIEGVEGVQVFREMGYADLKLTKDSPEIRAQVLKIIHELVNGKFKAKFANETGTFFYTPYLCIFLLAF